MSRNAYRIQLLSLVLFAGIGLWIFSTGYLFSSKIGLNSDLLYFEMFFRDLFDSPYKIAGWRFPGAAYFFPDMFLFFPLRAITGDFRLGLLLYSCVYISSLFLIWLAVLRQIFEKAAIYVLVPFCLILTALINLSTDYAINMFFGPSTHSGGVLFGSCCLLLLLTKMVQDRRTPSKESSVVSLGAIIVLIALQVLSDSSFIVQFLAPFCVLGAYWRWKGWISKSWIKKWLLSAFWILLIVLAVYRIVLFTRTGLHAVARGGSYGFIEQAKVIWDSIPFRHFDVALFTLVSGFYLLGGLADCVWISKKKTSQVTSADKLTISVFIFYLASFTVTVAVVLGKSLWTDFSNIRYFYPNVVFPFLGLSMLICKTILYCKERSFGRWIFYGFKLSGLIGVFISSILILRDFRQLPHVEYPSDVQCVDEFAKKHQRSFGLGGYWEAKYITALTKQNVWINQVKSENARAYHWLNNVNWYGQKGVNIGPEDFFVINKKDHLLASAVQRTFGKPLFTEDCGELSLLFFEKGRDLLPQSSDDSNG